MVLVPTVLELVRGVSVLEAGILFLGFSVPFGSAARCRVHHPFAHCAPDARARFGGDGRGHGGAGDRRTRRPAGLGHPRRSRSSGSATASSTARPRRTRSSTSRPTTPRRRRLRSARRACSASPSRSPISTSMMTTIDSDHPGDSWGCASGCSSARRSPAWAGGWPGGRRGRRGAPVASPRAAPDRDRRPAGARHGEGRVRARGWLRRAAGVGARGIASSLYGIDLADVPMAAATRSCRAAEEERLHRAPDGGARVRGAPAQYARRAAGRAVRARPRRLAHAAARRPQARQGTLRLDVPRPPAAQLVRGGDDQGVGARTLGGAHPVQARVHRRRRRPRDRGEVAFLARLSRGSWGKAVADFYDRHGFPFPGERFGIYELGARHDWVHVLAGYETTPEGELDVFAFIAVVDERRAGPGAPRDHARAVPEREHPPRRRQGDQDRAAPTRSPTTARSTGGSRRSGGGTAARPT